MMMMMKISFNTIVDRRDHVQYLTVSKSYSDNCTCSILRIMSRLIGENKKKVILFFFELLPFAKLDIENLISQKLF